MKNILFGSVALTIAAISSALAADIASPVYKAPVAVASPAYNWTGFYVGINGGGGWGRSRFDYNVGPIPTTGNYNTSGGLIGGTIGYNWQFATWVVGVEGDLDWSNIKGSAFCPNKAYTCQTTNTWLGTARGRLGYAANNWLVYGTGGAAWGSVKADFPIFPAINPLPGQTNTKFGWAAGGGVEYGVTPNLSIKVEYLYVDLGRAKCADPNCGIGANPLIPFSASTARLGVNYRFYTGP